MSRWISLLFPLTGIVAGLLWQRCGGQGNLAQADIQCIAGLPCGFAGAEDHGWSRITPMDSDSVRRGRARLWHIAHRDGGIDLIGDRSVTDDCMTWHTSVRREGEHLSIRTVRAPVDADACAWSTRERRTVAYQIDLPPGVYTYEWAKEGAEKESGTRVVPR